MTLAKGLVGGTAEDGLAPVRQGTVQLDQAEAGQMLVAAEGLDQHLDFGTAKGAFQEIVVIGGDDRGKATGPGQCGEVTVQRGRLARLADVVLEDAVQITAAHRRHKAVDDPVEIVIQVEIIVTGVPKDLEQAPGGGVTGRDRGPGTHPEHRFPVEQTHEPSDIGGDRFGVVRHDHLPGAIITAQSRRDNHRSISAKTRRSASAAVPILNSITKTLRSVSKTASMRPRLVWISPAIFRPMLPCIGGGRHTWVHVLAFSSSPNSSLTKVVIHPYHDRQIFRFSRDHYRGGPS